MGDDVRRTHEPSITGPLRGIRSFQILKNQLSSDPTATLFDVGFVQHHRVRGHWTSGASAYSMACSSVIAWPSADISAKLASPGFARVKVAYRSWRA